jgi:hypothetical protein
MSSSARHNHIFRALESDNREGCEGDQGWVVGCDRGGSAGWLCAMGVWDESVKGVGGVCVCMGWVGV